MLFGISKSFALEAEEILKEFALKVMKLQIHFNKIKN